MRKEKSGSPLTSCERLFAKMASHPCIRCFQPRLLPFLANKPHQGLGPQLMKGVLRYRGEISTPTNRPQQFGVAPCNEGKDSPSSRPSREVGMELVEVTRSDIHREGCSFWSCSSFLANQNTRPCRGFQAKCKYFLRHCQEHGSRCFWGPSSTLHLLVSS